MLLNIRLWDPEAFRTEQWETEETPHLKSIEHGCAGHEPVGMSSQMSTPILLNLKFDSEYCIAWLILDISSLLVNSCVSGFGRLISL